MPPPDRNDLNAVFQRTDGSLWRLVAVQENPTLTFEAVVGTIDGRSLIHERVTHAVGTDDADSFVRLVAAP